MFIITYFCFSTFYDILNIDFFFTMHDTYKNCNISIFERASPTEGIYPTDLFRKLEQINYKNPLPTIKESIYEENTHFNLITTPQLKSLALVTTHFFICYIMYTI